MASGMAADPWEAWYSHPSTEGWPSVSLRGWGLCPAVVSLFLGNQAEGWPKVSEEQCELEERQKEM